MAKTKNDSPLEDWEQKQIFRWVRANQIRYPKLFLAYGTLNGIRLSRMLATKAKEQGNRAGIPDIVLPAKSHDGEYPGLYLELKRLKGGTVSKDQRFVLELLSDQGYKAVVCKGHQAAITAICEYLGVKPPLF